MSARTSKEVTDRQKSCQFLITALLQQGPRVAEKLLALVRPDLAEGDEEPDFLTSIIAEARHLKASLARLVRAGESVYEANVRLQNGCERRQASFSHLACLVARLRLTLLRETARSPQPLLRQADRLGERFQRDDLEDLLGEPYFRQPIDPRPQGLEVASHADGLRQALAKIDEALRQTDEAQVEKTGPWRFTIWCSCEPSADSRTPAESSVRTSSPTGCGPPRNGRAALSRSRR